VESNPAEPSCTIETCIQGQCGATANPLKSGCCVQDDIAGYDFDGPCGMDGWTANPPAGQPKWQAHNTQKKSGSCSMYYGDPANGDYDNGGQGSSGCATSPIIDLTDPESDDDLYYSQVEVSYWLWVDVADCNFWADSYLLQMDQVLGNEPVKEELELMNKPCCEVADFPDSQCFEEPIAFPCDVFGCETAPMGQWVYHTFVLDLADYDWIPIPPYRAVFEFCFDTGDGVNNGAEGVYVDDFQVKTLCKL
jgi:hypothetical protein